LRERVAVLLVGGARSSSNSNRRREIGPELAVPSSLIDDAAAIDPAWFAGVTTVGLTAGASAPEELVREVIARLGEIGPLELETLEGIEENVRFKLPESLWDIAGSPYGAMGSPQREAAGLG